LGSSNGLKRPEGTNVTGGDGLGGSAGVSFSTAGSSLAAGLNALLAAGFEEAASVFAGAKGLKGLEDNAGAAGAAGAAEITGVAAGTSSGSAAFVFAGAKGLNGPEAAAGAALAGSSLAAA